jgi:hypothetical protein
MRRASSSTAQSVISAAQSFRHRRISWAVSVVSVSQAFSMRCHGAATAQ